MTRDVSERFRPFAARVKSALGRERVITLMRTPQAMQSFTQLSAWLIRKQGHHQSVSDQQIRIAYDVAYEHHVTAMAKAVSASFEFDREVQHSRLI